MEEHFSKLINLLWGECIRNLNKHLATDEQNKFSNNDYYYLLVIQSLENPNFSNIAEKLQMTKPAVTAMIRKLSAMDMVKKVQSESDKRMYYVKLTQKGLNILNGDKEVYRWVTNEIANICKNESELNLIENTITELVKRLEGQTNEM